MSRLAALDSHRFAALLAERLGLHGDGLTSQQLTTVLSARLRATASPDLDAYRHLLDQPLAGAAELAALAAEFAVGETYFFRGPDHWRALFEQVLPELHARADGRRLRLLSAGCASGEEPYTAAILLREWRPDLVDAVDIVGIDASAPLLEKARRGRYSPWSLRSTPAAWQSRYFRRCEGQFELTDDIRRSVRFEQRNLLAKDPLFWHAAAFDLILCRNVFIYFTPAAMRSVVAAFSDALGDGGFLFLGHSETLRGVSRAYHLREHGDAFYYQRRSAEEGFDPDPLFELWRDARDEAAATGAVAAAPAVAPSDDSWFAISQGVAARLAVIGTPTRPEPALTPAAESASPCDVLQAQASEAFAQDDFAGTEAACQALLDLDEFSAEAHYLIGLCRVAADDGAAAEIRLQAAIYLDARFALPHVQLGGLLLRGGRFAAARRHFRAALGLLPAERETRLGLPGSTSRAALAAICNDGLARCAADTPLPAAGRQ